jgi:hypothetical protein
MQAQHGKDIGLIQPALYQGEVAHRTIMRAAGRAGKSR